MKREIAGLYQRGNFPGEVCTDTRNFIELLRRELGHGNRLIAHGAGGIAIGADAKKVLPSYLKHVADIFENLCDLFVLDHGSGPVQQKLRSNSRVSIRCLIFVNSRGASAMPWRGQAKRGGDESVG
jgi:hypothetical protein